MKHTATHVLVTIAIALAIVVAVKVIQARAGEDVTALINIEGLTGCRDTAWQYSAPSESTCRYSESGDPVRVMWSNGKIDAIEDGEKLRVRKFPSFGNDWNSTDFALTYYHTPRGQLAACNSAEVIKILTRITNTMLSGIFSPTTLGGNDGKNLCAAGIRSPLWSSYTVEWLDKTSGRYWVQITGRLAR
jgi:hypothetical protein